MHLPAPKLAPLLPRLPTAGVTPGRSGWWWLVLRLLAGVFPLAAFGGCSLLLARQVPRRIESLNTRHHRADVIAELGSPRQSVAFSRPTPAPAIMFTPAAKAVRRDEYQISGLRLAPGDSIGIESRWAWYPVELVASVGLKEFSTLPETVGELARRAGQRDRLRVWYDRGGRVLTWEVHSDRYPEPPERPFGWAVRAP